MLDAGHSSAAGSSARRPTRQLRVGLSVCRQLLEMRVGFVSIVRILLECGTLQRYYSVVTMYRRVVNICTAQWSIYVPHSGQYMYRTVVNICTAQWSLYVPHSGHYMYRTVVAICTAQWSLYIPHSGHYTALWSLYVPHSGHYMYRTVVTICTA